MTAIGDIRLAEPLPVGTAELVDFVLATDPHAERAFTERTLLEDLLEDRQVVTAWQGDQLVGLGQTGHPQPMPRHWQTIRVLLDPAVRGRGLGGRLYRRMLELSSPSRRSLRARAYDHDPRDLAIARHWGFEVVQLSYTSSCDLAQLPPETPPPDGVTIEDCSTLDFPDADAVEAMYDRSQTNPERAQFVGDLAFLHRMAPPPLGLGALLRVEGSPAALIWAVKEPPAVHIAWTGVDPAFRGHGYAVLLKQALHRMARDAGAGECRTTNEEHNTGIRRVNAELGYRVEYGEYWLAQAL